MDLNPRNIGAHTRKSICFGSESTEICRTEIKILKNIFKIFSLSMITKVQITKTSSHYSRSGKRISLRFFRDFRMIWTARQY